MLLYGKQNIWPINIYLTIFNRIFRRKVVKMAFGCQKGTHLVWLTPHNVFKIGSYLYFNCTIMNRRDNLYLIIDILWFFHWQMEYGYCSHKGKSGLLSHWQLSLVKTVERNVNNIHLKIIFKKNFIIKSLPLVVSSSEGRVDTFNFERIKWCYTDFIKSSDLRYSLTSFWRD